MIGRRSQDDAQSFDEAWGGRTPRDAQIAELVKVAERLCEAASEQPSDEFRQSLRTRLMVEARTALVPMKASQQVDKATTRPARPVRRRVAGLTAALVASAGVVGLVASSASAVPGEMLYPVKRGVESVELALHRDDASRGSFQLAQASERLAEAQELSADDPDRSADMIADTLDDFSSQAQSGSSSLFNDFSSSGSEKSVQKVNDFAAAASTDLATLSDQIPSEADESFRAAAQTVQDLATQASSLCSSCSSVDLQSLVSAVTGYASSGAAAQESDTKESDSTTKGDTSDSTTAEPTEKPLVAAPTLAPTTEDPSLSDVTDPVIGALLGDEEQTGLVPGLLDPLLGN